MTAMTAMTPEQIERLVEAGSAAVGLHVAAEYRRGVAAYVGLAASMAALVDGLALTPADEPANVFHPVEPGGE